MLKVGKIAIDDNCYKDEDLYSDGGIEDEMLEIAKFFDETQYNKIIAKRKDWAILYHFSHLRRNIVSWIPMTKEDSVLEIGAGCGAITGALAKRGKNVSAVDLSMKRSLINAHRHKELDNIKLYVGNFEDVEKRLKEKYDIATLIGVFEYAVSFINTPDPYEEFLRIIKKRLNQGGRIIIAIENKFGLKYWAGCQEDHTGKYFEGLEGYRNTSYARTFSKVELERMFNRVGFEKWNFYYPYPDYKFPTKIFSDDYLPSVEELNNNYNNFDRERLVLFDELAVYNEIIKDNMFPYFSNSFLVILEG